MRSGRLFRRTCLRRSDWRVAVSMVSSGEHGTDGTDGTYRSHRSHQSYFGNYFCGITIVAVDPGLRRGATLSYSAWMRTVLPLASRFGEILVIRALKRLASSSAVGILQTQTSPLRVP